MFQDQSTQVSVLFYYDGTENYAHPVRLIWHGREYELGGVQFWYAAQAGGKLVHHYTVGDRAGNYTFQLALETENLTWRLEQADPLDHEAEGTAYPAFRFGRVAA